MIHRLSLRHAFAAFAATTLVVNLSLVGLAQWLAGPGLVTTAAIFVAGMLMTGVGALVGAHYGRRAEVIVSALNELATGNLERKLKLSGKDDFAWLAHEYDLARRATIRLVTAIRGSAGEVAGALGELDGATGLIGHASREQSGAATSIAGAMEETTASIRRVAESAEQARQIAEQASGLATQGKRDIDSLVGEIEGTSAAVQQSSSVIAELGRKSETVSTIVQAIKGIADQTNLLALNATIEAARAGEQGRGFAVVADEVRKLAERSSAATNDITGMISAMMTGTQQAVAGMEQCVRRVDAGVRIARQAGTSVQALDDSAKHTRARVEEIAAAMREQSQATDVIGQNLERISRMAEDNRAAVAATQDVVGTLGRLSGNLQDAVGGFRTA